MLAFPLPPRLARLVVAAAELGISDEGAAAAALLGERDLLRASGFDGRGRGQPKGAHHDTASSDLLPRLDALDEAERLRFDGDRLRSLGLDVNAARGASRARRQLDDALRRSSSPSPRPPSPDDALALAVLLAFPDRVAARRKPGERELVLAGGGTALLAEESVVRDAALLVAISAEERPRGGPLVRIASAVDADQLMDRFPDRVREEVVAKWVADGERVEAVKRLVYDGIALEERRVPADGVPEVGERLAAEASRVGARTFAEAGAVDRLLARAAFAASLAPEVVRALTEADVEEALSSLCVGRASFAELRSASLVQALEARLDGPARSALARLAPDRVVLHAGWSPRVEYATGRPPWIEALLQDFFGLAKGPAVGGGRVPVVLHLLGPNHRPVQVTSDLEGFWARHYPAVRKELSRLYPRHDWPDEPRTATPRHKPARRRRG
jgi:ATP-dependent helicase HrpB